MADLSDDPPITIFVCGPSKCGHVYDHYVPIIGEDGRDCGSTLACGICGATAYGEAAWT